MSGVVCALRDVSLRRSERFTLRVPSLVIGPGLTVVRGANASGKSTLLQVLATALRHHHGTVTIGGREVAPAQARPSAADDAAVGAIRAGLGYLPQGDTTATRTRVFDHVDVLAVARDIAASTRSRQAQVAGALAAVGMAGLAGERCGRLSGGQRRRVALAGALAGRSDLLVLDEPDAGLDDEFLATLATVLADRAGRATVVVAVHRDDWLAGVAHRVVTLDAGVASAV